MRPREDFNIESGFIDGRFEERRGKETLLSAPLLYQ